MIVVQCWDDGVIDDIKVADICRKYNAKATFNLCAGLFKKERGGPWKRPSGKEVWKLALGELHSVYDGFDIANHSANHFTAGRQTDEECKKDIIDGKKWLEDFFGFRIRGYVYPCGGYNDAVKNIVREAGHIYARTTKYSDDPIPPADWMELPSNCHFLASDFYDKFNKAKEKDSIFYFWGHSYEMEGDEMFDDFEKKIAHISASPSVKWEFLADVAERLTAGN